MGSLRLPLLVLIWRTLAVFGDSCESIEYLSSPRPIYKIEQYLDVNIYTCNVYRYSAAIENITTVPDGDPLLEIINRCLKYYKKVRNCPGAAYGRSNVSVLCNFDDPKQNTEVRVYQIKTKANIEANAINIDGKNCAYDSGSALITGNYGNKTLYVWQVLKKKPELNPCDDKSIYRLGYQWVGKLKTNTSSQYIAITALYDDSKMYSLELLKSKQFECGTVWPTKIKGIIVSNRELDSGDANLYLKNYQKLLQPLKSVCDSVKKTNYSERGVAEVQITQDKMFLVYLLISLYIVGKLFNVVVNYCTLRKFQQRKGNSGRMYIFYCLMQSLTNRYIYLSKEVCDNSSTANATHNNIKNDSRNGYDSDGYLKPVENHAKAAEYSLDNRPDSVNHDDDNISDGYLKYLNINNSTPINEVYSYAYMKK